MMTVNIYKIIKLKKNRTYYYYANFISSYVYGSYFWHKFYFCSILQSLIVFTAAYTLVLLTLVQCL